MARSPIVLSVAEDDILVEGGVGEVPVLRCVQRAEAVDVDDGDVRVLDDDAVVERAAEVDPNGRVDNVADRDGRWQEGGIEPHATNDASPVVGGPVRAIAKCAEEPDGIAGDTVDED